MTSSLDSSGEESGFSFLGLPSELRRKIYRNVFPDEEIRFPGVAQGRSYQNILYTNSQVYQEASYVFYSESTFLIEIGMNMTLFLGKVFHSGEGLCLPCEELYYRIRKLRINIIWHHQCHVGHMRNGRRIERAAVKIQTNIANVCSALARIVRLEYVEVVCESLEAQVIEQGLVTSVPGPLLTKDIFWPFESMQLRRRTTRISITNVEEFTGQRSRPGQPSRKSLTRIVIDLARSLGTWQGRISVGSKIPRSLGFDVLLLTNRSQIPAQ